MFLVNGIQFNHAGVFMVRTYASNENLRAAHNVVLSLFVGKVDKNDKEIFEGDIVEWYADYDKTQGGKAIITYNEQECLFFPSVEKTKGSDFYGLDGQRNFAWRELKVIGNVFEHPELI